MHLDTINNVRVDGDMVNGYFHRTLGECLQLLVEPIKLGAFEVVEVATI